MEKTIQQPKRTGFTILWKCLLAALPLLAFALLFVLFPMHFYDVEYPRWRWEQQALSDTKIEADVVFLGDSLIQSGIIPVAWGEGAINLALGGATSAEMDFALDQYLNYHDAPELIVMGYGQNHYIEMNGYWNRSLYFHYLPLGRQIDLIERAWKMNDRTVFGGHIACEDTLAYFFYAPDRYLPALLSTIEEKQRTQTNRTEYLFSEDVLGYYPIGYQESCGDASASVAYDEFTPSAVLDEYTRSIIRNCEDNGIRLVIERPPCNQATMDATNETFAAQYATYLESLAAEFPGVVVNTKIEVYPDDCFGDPGHLNQRGAERYTASLVERYAALTGG